MAALGKEVGTAWVTAAVGMATARQEVEPEADRTVREAAEMVAVVAATGQAVESLVAKAEQKECKGRVRNAWLARDPEAKEGMRVEDCQMDRMAGDAWARAREGMVEVVGEGNMVLVEKKAEVTVVGKEPVAEVRATGASVKEKGRGQPEAEAKGAAAAAEEVSAGVVGVEMEGLAGKQGPDLAPPSQSRRAGRPGLGWRSVRQPAP